MKPIWIYVTLISLLIIWMITIFVFLSPIMNFMSNNRDLSRLIWLCSGIIGILILRKTRSEEMNKHKGAALIINIIFHIIFGPLVFILSLITLIPVKNEISKGDNI